MRAAPPPKLFVALVALYATGCLVVIERELDDKPSAAELASAARAAAKDGDARAPLADTGTSESDAAIRADGAPPDRSELDAGADATSQQTSSNDAATFVDARSPNRDTPLKLCVGASHACGLMPSGKLTCWGRNDDYQLDLGRDTPSEGYRDLACGDYHTCAITSAGVVRCAGRNRSGQASLAPSDSGYVQVSAGDAHSCALRADGSAVCWGDASHTQNAVPSGTPALKAISSGAQFNCGLRSADDLPVCWGNPGAGRLIAPQHAFVKIAAGGETACGVTANGKVECWGLGSSERLLDAVELSINAHTSVSALQACAIRSDRSLYCWDSDAPAPTTNTQKFAAVAVGPTAICALTESGVLTCTSDEPGASIATAKPPNYPDEPLTN